MTHPFTVPAELPPRLARVHGYWTRLLRGAAEMPFWDDAKLTDLPDLANRMMLIDVFERPQRFRFSEVGEAVTDEPLEGLFLDEIELQPPFEFLLAQASATIESAAPSFFRLERQAGQPDARAYGRLLLPMWGEGRIGMLLGAFDFA